MKITGPKSPQAAPDNEAPVADDERADLDEPAADLQESLDWAATYAAAPAGRAGEQLESGASLYELGRDLGGSIGDGTREAHGGVSTGGVWGSLTVDHGTDDGQRSGVSAYYEPGWLSGGGSHEWADKAGGRKGVGASLALWDGGLGASVSHDITRADGSGLELGAFLGLDADRAITDLGEQPDGTRRIEVSRTKGGMGYLSPGAFGSVIGIGGKLGGGRSREVTYRTTVTDDEARTLLHERGGVVGWARDRARGLELADDPVVIPDLRAPETLAVGDEVLTVTSGELKAGLFIGGLPFRLGAQGTLQGDFEVAAKRLDEHHYSLVVTPRDVRGAMTRMGVPIALDGDISRVTAKALRQAFVFDLREDGARDAWERALDGELPGGTADGATVEAEPDDERDALGLREALAAESLPTGVQRSYLETVHAERRQLGIGFAVGLWHRSGPFVGLGQQKVTGSHKSEVVTREGVWTRDVRGTERRRQLLLSGEETRGVFAAVKRATIFGDDGESTSAFGGLELELKLGDSRVRGLELNDDVIAELNEALDLDLQPFTREGRKKSRQVTLRRTLDASDLVRLAESSSDALHELRRSLATTQDDTERAERVQRFLADEGLGGFAAVCVALGGGREAFDLATTSSAYDEPPEKASALALRYPQPVTRDLDKGGLTERFGETLKALREVRESLLDARADPLLSDREAESILDQLKDAERTLAAVIDVSHLDDEARGTLADRLERGWTTGTQRHVIEHLLA